MNGIFYLVGLIVVALLVVYALGLCEERSSQASLAGAGERAMASVRASAK
jgi:hypothetical protein